MRVSSENINRQRSIRMYDLNRGKRMDGGSEEMDRSKFVPLAPYTRLEILKTMVHRARRPSYKFKLIDNLRAEMDIRSF
jgi:hypothetical protein